MPPVHLDDDLLRRVQQRRRQPHRGREEHASVPRHFGRFNDGDVDLAEEAEEQRLRDVRQVHVDELHGAAVDLGPQLRARLIRRAPGDGFGVGEIVIEIAGGGAGDHPDLERPSGAVLVARTRGQRLRHELGRTRRGEAAETYGVSVTDVRGGLVGGQGREGHDRELLRRRPCRRW